MQQRHPNSVHAILLAAGKAERFGDSKLEAHLDGRPIIQHSLESAQQAFPGRVCLVTGKYRASLLDAASGGYDQVAHNAAFDSGIGSSIACGVNAVRGKASAIVILLGDQPLITAAFLRRLAKTWNATSEHIVAARFASTLGPPVLFGSDYFDALEKLDDDSGAKQILTAHRDNVTGIDFEPAVVDIDTPQELSLLTTQAE